MTKSPDFAGAGGALHGFASMHLMVALTDHLQPRAWPPAPSARQHRH